MTYDEALSFWYGRINYEVRSAQPADLKLERMRALLRRLGNPHERVRLVHVTGTKGKGSTCAMLASVLQAAGYRVGLFTSPHLTHVEERVQVNGVSISREELAACMELVAPAVREMDAEDARDEPGRSLTFFEIGTAIGFLHFVRRRCDIAIIEVGLGGRFDSTNVCLPLVSVITNVGLDHTAQLGHTLEAIAYQKAGIIKRRVAVVSGVTQEGPREVVRQVAAELDAPLWEFDRDYAGLPFDEEGKQLFVWPGFSPQPHEPLRIAALFVTPRGNYAPLRVGLLGKHQIVNASTALAVIERLRDAGMPIPDDSIRVGLSEVRWPARVELVTRTPITILDTAHNVPSAEALVNTLRESFPTQGEKRVIFAVSSDKPASDILRVLAGYFDHFYLTKYANNPRSVPPEKLAAVLNDVAPGKPFSTHAASTEAWGAARTAAGADDLVCITGSVFLAGELRPVVRPS